jgi:hypothetical protein
MAKGCFYCWFVGRLAPWGMLALAAVLWLVDISRELNFTAAWLVVIALGLLGGSWVLGRFSKKQTD